MLSTATTAAWLREKCTAIRLKLPIAVRRAIAIKKKPPSVF